MNIIFVGSVFVAGIFSFFAPCIIPLLPVYIGLLSDRNKESKSFKLFGVNVYLYTVLKSFMFVMGISTSFIILGFGASSLSFFLKGKLFVRIMGVIVIILGLHQVGLLNIAFLKGEKKFNLKRSYKSDLLGSYALGFTFSFGWSPCIGPVLGSVFAISSSSNSTLLAVSMMAVYALGLSIPFLVISIFSEVFLEKAKATSKHMDKFKIVGGILIILMGLLMIFGNINQLTSWFSG